MIKKKFNYLYTFIFALTLFMVGNISVNASNTYNLTENIKDLNGNDLPTFNIYQRNIKTFFPGTNNFTEKVFFSHEENDFKYFIKWSQSESRYELFILPDYVRYYSAYWGNNNYYANYKFEDTYPKIRKIENSDDHNKLVIIDFGTSSRQSNSVYTNWNNAVGLSFTTSTSNYTSAINSNTYINYYNLSTGKVSNYFYEFNFVRFYLDENNEWVNTTGLLDQFYLSYQDSNYSYNYDELIFSSFNIYEEDGSTIYHESDVIKIPDIDVSMSINKTSNGSYSVGLNVIPVKKDWYIEITNLQTGEIYTNVIDSDMLSYSHVFSNIVSNQIYNVRIYNNDSKGVLYYQKSFNAIIDDEKPHIVIDSLDFNDNDSYTIKYYYANTTNKNICKYAIYDLDWISHDCSLYDSVNNMNNLTISHNGLFGLQIINNKTDDVVDEYMLNMIPDTSAIYMTFADRFNLTTRILTLNYKTFNATTTDSLYYSLDNTNWTYLNDFNGSIDFVKSGINVYFKLVDSSGNIKYKTIYNLNFNANGDYTVNDNKTFFNSIQYYISNFFDAIMVLWNNINNEIKVAVLTILPTIILCIAIDNWRRH